MPRILSVGAIIFVCLGASCGLAGETADPRLDDAIKEIAILKRTVGDQDRRISSLERTVRSLQTTVLAATRPAPTNWRTLEGWAAVKIGMSRGQVVEILGEPKSTEAVIDRQTLFYKDAADHLVGNVVITDDRVSEVASPRFQIYAPSQK